MKKLKLLLCLCVACFCISVFPTKALATEITVDTVTPITPPTIKTGDENITSFDSYDVVVSAFTKSITVPIVMNHPGQLNIDLLGIVLPNGINVGLYHDVACTSEIGYGTFLSSSSIESDLNLTIPKKGTYYLNFSFSYTASADATITMKPYTISGSNKTLTNKKWVASYPFSYSTTISHKITIKKPGYIKVQGSSLENNSSMYCTLTNSKKNAISNSLYLSSNNNYTTYFAVKKGTYYLNMSSSYAYKVRYSLTTVKDQGGSSKSKAKALTKGKTVKGLNLQTDSVNKADWYKVKLSKKQKLKFDFSAKANDSIKLEIIPANSRYTLWNNTVRLYSVDSTSITSQDSLLAGTYYFKITKTDKKASGYYTIKLK